MYNFLMGVLGFTAFLMVLFLPGFILEGTLWKIGGKTWKKYGYRNVSFLSYKKTRHFGNDKVSSSLAGTFKIIFFFLFLIGLYWLGKGIFILI